MQFIKISFFPQNCPNFSWRRPGSSCLLPICEQSCKTWSYSSCKAVIQLFGVVFFFFPELQLKVWRQLRIFSNIQSRGLKTIFIDHPCVLPCSSVSTARGIVLIHRIFDQELFCVTTAACIYSSKEFKKKKELGKSWYFLPGDSGVQELHWNSFTCRCSQHPSPAAPLTCLLQEVINSVITIKMFYLRDNCEHWYLPFPNLWLYYPCSRRS